MRTIVGGGRARDSRPQGPPTDLADLTKSLNNLHPCLTNKNAFKRQDPARSMTIRASCAS